MGAWLASVLEAIKSFFKRSGTSQVGSGNQSVTVSNGTANVAGGSITQIHVSATQQTPDFKAIQQQMPDLFRKMRVDLLREPIVREFVVVSHGEAYVPEPGKTVFTYSVDDIPGLRDKVSLLENNELVRRLIKYNNYDRLAIGERLVQYLIESDSAPRS